MEICVGNEWGTVCHDEFSNVDAKVVCRKLNYLTTGMFVSALCNVNFMII